MAAYPDVTSVMRTEASRSFTRLKSLFNDTSFYQLPYSEIKINNNSSWIDEHWKSIEHNYKKAPFYDDYAQNLKDVYEQDWEYLADLNMALIKKISQILGLDTKFICSSELNVEGNKTDRLISVLKDIGADEYISSPGSKSYMEVEKFKKENIILDWYNYDHPTYQLIHLILHHLIYY